MPLADRSHLLGDGVFETVRTTAGRPFQLAGHMERLRQGLKVLRIPVEAAEEAEAALRQLARRAWSPEGPDLYLRVQVSTGDGEALTGRPGSYRVTALARPLRPRPAPRDPNGLVLARSAQAKPTGGPLLAIKGTSFLWAVHARREAEAAGADDAVLFNDQGRVAEASTSNLLGFSRRRVYAPGPSEGALGGLTRALLLEAARSGGYEIQESLPGHDLARLEELVLTNSVIGVAPAARLLDPPVAFAGNRGTAAQEMQRAYAAALEKAARAPERVPARISRPAAASS